MEFLIFVAIAILGVILYKKAKEHNDKKEREARDIEVAAERENKKKEKDEYLKNLVRAAEAGDVQAKHELGEHYRKETHNYLNLIVTFIRNSLGFGLAELKRGYVTSQGVVNNCHAALRLLEPLKACH